MKSIIILISISALLLMVSCGSGVSVEKANKPDPVVKDGIFVHITHGPENPHYVLMALNMAVLMADSLDVMVYLDINGVLNVLRDSPDIEFAHFPSSHRQLRELLDRNITVMACPGCLKAANKTPDDLMPGVKVANKKAFFNFTKGRILTIDY